MNEKEYLTNKNFCPIPWTGLMYNFDGNVKNCIRSSEPIGNIQKNNIEDILSGKENTSTKENMLANKPGSRCNPCYELDKEKKSFEIISDRIFYLRELKSVPLSLYSEPTNFNLQKIDVRWSNLCNFACVYCSPDFSSRWENELKLKITTPNENSKTKFAEYIYKNLSQLKHVYLAGGEPLLMKENLRLLELLSQENPNVNLRINTNLSKADTKIFEKICEFKNVHWTVSVESIEDEYEYIRYGGRWLDFVDNLTQIQSIGHKISFNMLHFLLNYKSIFKCIDWLQARGFHPNSFIIQPLLEPEYLNIRHLPQDVLHSVMTELQSRIDSGPGFLLENGYRNMSQYITKPFEKNLAESINKIEILDQRRGLDSKKVFANLYKYVN